MADDWDSGGPVRDVCGGYENAQREAVIHLRLLAGVFRLVLTGRAPQLVRFYPCLGGTAPASQACSMMREVIGAHIEEMHAALAVPPQTNEVGRSAALLAGLFDLVAASGCWSLGRARASICCSTTTRFAAHRGTSAPSTRRSSSWSPSRVPCNPNDS